MDIQYYLIEPDKPQLDIVPASRYREWLSPHAYRCTPLAVANTLGWDLVTPVDLKVFWNGGNEKDDVEVIDGGELIDVSFGIGTFTFGGMCGISWRTPPGWFMQFGPVPNGDVIGADAMNAIAETDWLNYPVFPTMRLRTPGITSIPAGTAIIRVTPVNIRSVDRCTLTRLDEPADMQQGRYEWTLDRNAQGLETGPRKRQWIKRYFNTAMFRQMHMPYPDDMSTPVAPPCEPDPIEEPDAVSSLHSAGIHLVEEYLTKEECSTIIAHWDGGESMDYECPDHWKGRCAWPDLPEELNYKMRTQITELAEARFNDTLEQENLHMVIWRKGDEMPAHSDFGADHEFPERKYTMVLALNDNYEGGATMFPEKDMGVKLDAGSLVLFAGGDTLHGVLEVTKGERFTMVCWWGPK